MNYSSSKVSGIAIAVALALSAATAGAESLQDAFAAAYETTPDLISARARLRVVDENVPIARAGQRPFVSATVTGSVTDTSIEGPVSGGTDESYTASVGASQVLYDGGQTYNSVAGAIADVICHRLLSWACEDGDPKSRTPHLGQAAQHIA